MRYDDPTYFHNTTHVLKYQETLQKRGVKDCKNQRTGKLAFRLWLLNVSGKLHCQHPALMGFTCSRLEACGPEILGRRKEQIYKRKKQRHRIVLGDQFPEY